MFRNPRIFVTYKCVEDGSIGSVVINYYKPILDTNNIMEIEDIISGHSPERTVEVLTFQRLENQNDIVRSYWGIM